ncbi:glycosyltransferase family 4 protein [Dietzia maris]
MGVRGVKAFQGIGFPKERCLEFGYFVEDNLADVSIPRDRLVFVGSLVGLKNVDKILRVMRSYNGRLGLDIIGDGPLRAELESKATGLDVKFLGVRSNDEVRDSLAQYKALLLPSAYDGWGAVVNEALMAGTPVIVSRTSGSSSLIDGPGPDRGQVINANNTNAFARSLQAIEDQDGNDPARYKEIASWARSSISAEAGARYLFDVAESLRRPSSPESLSPIPPWRV